MRSALSCQVVGCMAFFVACGITTVASAQATTNRTIRIVCYNIDADQGQNGAQYTLPQPGLITPSSGGSVTNGGVLEGIGEEVVNGDPAQPIDILALEETTSNTTTVQPIVDGLNTFYSVHGPSAGYAMSPYQATESGGSPTSGNGPNAIVYNTYTVQLLASVPVDPPGGTSQLGSASGEYREVMRYEFAPAGVTPATNNEFYIYVSHYKADSGSIYDADRLGEATIIRNDESTNLPPNSRVIYLGDYNVDDGSGEPGYQTILSNSAPDGMQQGQGVDPLNPSGSTTINWEASTTDTNILFMLTEEDYELRYRDDLQVMTSNVYYDVAEGLQYVPRTYHAFGNNGSLPYGDTVVDPSNTALSGIPSNAYISPAQCYTNLTTASDHLPVVVDYTIPIPASVCSYTINTSSSPSGGGTTSGGGTVACGSNVTVCAAANSCYGFVNWTVGGNVVSTSACYSFIATGNQTLVANFAANGRPTLGTLKTLHSFVGASDGTYPVAGLVQASDGNFYGTTYSGGAYGNGAAFRITPSGTLTLVHSFSPSEGDYPYAGMVQGNDGYLYGTTYWGGSSRTGAVFRMSLSGSLTTLWSFSGSDGTHPEARLVQGSDGNFYGTTYSGGASGNGSVFKISSSGSLTTLWSFTGGSDGGSPYAGLVQGSDGNFYGTTEEGGANYYYGTVFRISPSGSLTTLHSFGYSDGAYPLAGLVQGSDGNFYGTTYLGGANGPGTVFKISPTGSLTNLWSFTGCSDGAYPEGALVQGSDGNFYGTTYGSGSGPSGYGSVFQISPSGSLTSLWWFTNGVDGGNPWAGLVQGSDGSFYGTTAYGGASGRGALFKLSVPLNPPPNTINTSSSPSADGSTSGAGTYTNGAPVTVSATPNPCYSFVNWTDGGTMVSTSAAYSFVLISNRTLVANFAPTFYTITANSSPSAGGIISGAGTVPCGSNVTVCATANSCCYNFANWTDQNSNTVSTSACYSFTPAGDQVLVANFTPIIFTVSTNSSPSIGGTITGAGAYPFGSNVTLCATANSCFSFANWTVDGNMVSTSACYTFATTTNQTVVANFALTTLAGNLTPLWSFTGGSDGNYPDAGLVRGSDGNFYGTTYSGGAYSYGTVFQITPSGSLTTLWSFTGGSDGNYPYAGLVQGSDGNFYGTTVTGGANGSGTVFQITPGGALTTLWSFTGGNDGDSPATALVQGNDGNFYGTTYDAGANGAGTVFQITSGGSLTTLWSFTGGSDGANSYGSLVQGSDSNFYGTTSEGGASGNGAVFKISSSGSLTTLWSFTGGNDGGYPLAGLAPGGDGNFYGTTYDGGANAAGTVFQITPDGSLTTLWSFTGGNDGAGPAAALVQASDGYFYGTTSGGGASGIGAAFRISRTGTLTNLWSFTNCADGATPTAALAPGGDGNLYGTTYGSGSGPSANGSVFELAVSRTITTSSSPPAGGSTTGDGVVAPGSNVTVCATANPSYGFVNWTVNGNTVSTLPCYTFTAADDENLVANFTLVDSVGDGILDIWRQSYFGGSGATTNNLSCATCDADGTGQNNLFKYVAGLDPTNPASVFLLNIATVPNQPPWQNLLFNPVVGGRTYTPQFSPDLVSGVWLPLTTYTGPLTNGNQVTITDTNPIPPQEFYRVHISLP